LLNKGVEHHYAGEVEKSRAKLQEVWQSAMKANTESINAHFHDTAETLNRVDSRLQYWGGLLVKEGAAGFMSMVTNTLKSREVCGDKHEH
jgi:hypothetical protein